MPLFQWTGAHCVFLPPIDSEHEGLFRAAGQLHEAVEAQAPLSRRRELLCELAALVEAHFSHEERLMRAASYSSYGWHKQEHDGLRRSVKRFIRQLDRQGEADWQGLLDYVSIWLEGHTSIADPMMSAHLRNRQRAGAAAVGA